MNFSQKESWDRAAEEYASLHNSDKRGHFAEEKINWQSILSLLPPHSQRLLDYGCGPGTFTHLATEIADQVEGVDISSEMIRLAKTKYPDLPFTILDDEKALPETWNNSFDVVLSKLSIMFVEDIDQVLAAFVRVLRPGGIFVVSMLHPTYWLKQVLDPKSNESTRLGYFQEGAREKITGDSRSVMQFQHRTLETYHTAFRKAGFVLRDIREPILDSEELLPKRLNMQLELLSKR